MPGVKSGLKRESLAENLAQKLCASGGRIDAEATLAWVRPGGDGKGGVWQVKVAACGSNEARIENAVLEAWHEASLTRLSDKRMPMKLKLKFTHTDTHTHLQTRTHVSVQLSEGVHKVHAKLFYAFRMLVS